LAHDGRNFGIHEIDENPQNAFSIKSSFVKRNGGKYGGDWTVRISVEPAKNRNSFVSVIFYFAADHSTGWLKSKKKSKTTASFVGITQDLGEFKVKIIPSNELESTLNFKGLISISIFIFRKYSR
jgi:mannosyl-oligosaccharide glucosidase